MIYFTAHTFNCVCHCIKVMFRVLGMYNFGINIKKYSKTICHSWIFHDRAQKKNKVKICKLCSSYEVKKNQGVKSDKFPAVLCK